MTKKLQKLKANMLVIMDLTQNYYKQMLSSLKIIDFDSSYVTGKSHFEEDGEKNYLVFQ